MQRHMVLWPSIGAIVGGTVAAVVLIISVAGVNWLCLGRRRRKNRMIMAVDKEDEGPVLD